MTPLISEMLEGYEVGRISRCQMIHGVAALAAGAYATPASGSTFQ